MSEPIKTKIPAEFESSVQGGYVDEAGMIVDRTNYPDSPKSQAEINADILTRLAALEGNT